ncbi:hypothetical protein BC830DRAFT_1091699 [Chytriomyces sp. MP71]|nr:hypothetical protein BC830DRAFT_1091699 [Chytriomyces sp. MP71]
MPGNPLSLHALHRGHHEGDESFLLISHSEFAKTRPRGLRLAASPSLHTILASKWTSLLCFFVAAIISVCVLFAFSRADGAQAVGSDGDLNVNTDPALFNQSAAPPPTTQSLPSRQPIIGHWIASNPSRSLALLCSASPYNEVIVHSANLSRNLLLPADIALCQSNNVSLLLSLGGIGDASLDWSQITDGHTFAQQLIATFFTTPPILNGVNFNVQDPTVSVHRLLQIVTTLKSSGEVVTIAASPSCGAISTLTSTNNSFLIQDGAFPDVYHLLRDHASLFTYIAPQFYLATSGDCNLGTGAHFAANVRAWKTVLPQSRVVLGVSCDEGAAGAAWEHVAGQLAFSGSEKGAGETSFAGVSVWKDECALPWIARLDADFGWGKDLMGGVEDSVTRGCVAPAFPAPQVCGDGYPSCAGVMCCSVFGYCGTWNA